MKFEIILSVLLTVMCLSASAQKIKGKIIDQTTNKPLAGATIKFSENGGTISNNYGEFTFSCSKNSELIISYIGYSTKKQTIQECVDGIIMELSTTNNNLNEVEISASSNNDRTNLLQPLSISKFLLSN